MVFLALWGWATGSPVAAQQPPPSPTFDLSQAPPPADLPVGRFGRGIYLENCAPCHGQLGLGDGPTAADLPSPPTAFADPQAVWGRSPAELFHTTKFGRLEKLMPPWQNELDDTQIWNVVAYAWSLHTDAGAVAMGADLYGLSCANCHGAGGAGDGPEAGVDLPDFTDLSYAMTRSQEQWLSGWMQAHPEVGGEWALSDQEQVLEYIRTFSYVPPWESPYRPGDGVISGQVVQGSSGGTTPDAATVTLEAYANFEPVAVFTGTVDAAGGFEFVDLAVDAEIVYLASVEQEGIRYSSPLVSLTPDQPVGETRVTVFAATDDPSGIQIDRAHWIIDSQPGALLFGEVLSFGSTADRTYTGSMVEGVDVPVTVALHVPAGAQEIIFENGTLGDRFRRVGDIVYDTSPVVPGADTKQIIVRYAVPYDGASAEVIHEYRYPVAEMSMLVADLPDLQVEVSGLTSVGAQDFQGQVYQIWQQQDAPAGEITVRMSGLLEAGAFDPRAAAVDGSQAMAASAGSVSPGLEPWMVWFSALLVAGVLGGGLAWSWRNGRIRSADPAGDLRRQHSALVQQIAHLDDLHALGEIDQDAWQTQRAHLKAQLLEIARRQADRAAAP